MKNKQYIFLANWKMNMSFGEAVKFAENHKENLVMLADTSHSKIVLLPSFDSINRVSTIFKETSKNTSIEIGSQNCSCEKPGSFTGQVSAKSLQEIGINFCLIGHSEARKHLHETNKEIKNKIILLNSLNITPVLCIGETNEDFLNKKTETVLERQILDALQDISITSILIAYEPIWAIGTGKTPDQNHLEQVLSKIKSITNNLKADVKLLYGGSVSHENISTLKEINLIDGFLVGNASLDFQNFKKIVE